MELRKKNRRDGRWGHPESVEEGFYILEGNNTYDGIGEMPEDEKEKKRMEQFGPALFDLFDETEGPEWVAWRTNGDWKEYYTEHGCPEEPDAPPVRILVRIPKDLKAREKLPAVFSICGGGVTAIGTPEAGASVYYRAMDGCNLRAVMVSLQYRLGPAHKYPKAINDCHAAYLWMLEHAEELHINTDKIVLLGGSTGGHLVLSLGFRLKRYDYHGKMPRGIIACTPVLDDTALTESFKYTFENENGTTDCWDEAMVQSNMRLWLGDRFGDPSLPPEAVPSRATLEDMRGYPPVWFPCNAEFEPSRDTGYKFAALLHEAGVFCDLHVWGGATHATGAGRSEFANRIWNVVFGALSDAVKYDFRRLWLTQE